MDIVADPYTLVYGVEPIVRHLQAIQLFGVEVHGKGGHSMVPPNDGSSAVSRLARIMLQLEKKLPRPRIESPTSDMLKVLARVAEKPIVSFLLRACETW